MSYPVIVLTAASGVSSGASTVYVVDTFKNPVNIGLGCVITAGSPTYTVEHTFDDVYAPTFDPATATWFANSGLTSKSANDNGNYAYPINGIRVRVVSGSGTVKLYVLQAGAR